MGKFRPSSGGAGRHRRQSHDRRQGHRQGDSRDRVDRIPQGRQIVGPTIVHVDGKVGWTQPIDADPKRNFNADSWEVYGAGAFLLAGSEVVKLKL